jgi:phosphonate transport system substrate-binding protein
MKPSLLTITLLFLSVISAVHAAEVARTYSFAVVNQRTPLFLAKYWNPILRYVSEKSGVPLRLKIGRTAVDTTALLKAGKVDFAYSNHVFLPETMPVGYQVFARPVKKNITGEIVVLANSPIRSLKDLAGHSVAFPSPIAFVGYQVTMDALWHAGILVHCRFAGNQEGAMGQLKAGLVTAASVNSAVLQDYARREQLAYRVIWRSEPFLNVPIAALPSIPSEKVKAVQAAFIHMAEDPMGLQILEDSARLARENPPYGFVAAQNAQYASQVAFYKTARTKVAVQ